MVVQRRAAPMMAVLFMLLLAACARPVEVRSAPSGAAAAEEGVPILVEHNLATATSMTVSLVDPAGVTHLLGNVNPGATVTFNYAGAPVAGNYYLIAETTTGEQLVSRPFGLPDTGTVNWDLAINSITTG